ncbi:hypothetical protein OHB56_21125 [Streptomyces sp. NBC_01635]|uniref:hypothetical protein n=1 Tax=Streptomyces sp. NBC_01635 TaxID=2975904 RepID=UPI003869CBBA|nr:hypothetical protein OHB56_21125 [Streptomyces sp. NBC_01635]
MKRDPLLWAALAAVLVVLASAEYELAVACGFGTYVAAGVPAALDVYALAALRARRDVLAVVLTLIAVNAASHLVEVGLLPVSVPLVVAVSAVAPLVLWRVHRLSEVRPAAPEVTEPVTVERVEDDQPEPVALVARPLPEVVPASARMLPVVARPEPVEVATSVPAETGRQVVTEVVTLTPAELRRKASKLHREAVRSTNRPVTIKTLQDELSLSRREATELRREIVGDRS